MTALLLRTMVAVVAVTCWSAPAVSAERCEGRIATTREHIREAVAFFGYGEQCRAYRLVTPNYRCSVSFTSQHGPGGFKCGPDFGGVWGTHLGRSPGAALTVVGTDRKVELPQHTELRSEWLGPIDSEGAHKNYPVQVDEYIDFYPREFTTVGVRKTLSNEGVVQAYQYETMKGEPRAAVAGSVDAGCIELYFVHWTSPELSADAEAHMTRFLEDLRLEGIKLDQSDAAEMCNSPLARPKASR